MAERVGAVGQVQRRATIDSAISSARAAGGSESTMVRVVNKGQQARKPKGVTGPRISHEFCCNLLGTHYVRACHMHLGEAQGLAGLTAPNL